MLRLLAHPSHLVDRPVADEQDTSRRHIDEVALEEVGALMLHILEQSGSMHKAELGRTACRLPGMNRVPTDAEARAARQSNCWNGQGWSLLRPAR